MQPVGLEFTQWIKWRSAESNECVSSDCSINTPVSRRSNYCWILAKNYTMKTKEQFRRLQKKVNEKSWEEYKEISKPLNIPWSTVNYHIEMEGLWYRYKSAYRSLPSHTVWPCKKVKEGGHQDIHELAEGVTSLYSWDGRDYAYNNFCSIFTSLHFKTKDKKAEYIFVWRHVEDSKVNWKKVLLSGEAKIITNTPCPKWSMVVEASCCGEASLQHICPVKVEQILEKNLMQSVRKLRRFVFSSNFCLKSPTPANDIEYPEICIFFLFLL